MVTQVNKNNQQGADDTTQQLKAAVPDCDRTCQVISESAKVVEHVEYACADDACDEAIKRGVGNHLRVGRDVSAQTPDDVAAARKPITIIRP